MKFGEEMRHLLSTNNFLCAFAKLFSVTIIFDISLSLCLSVRPSIPLSEFIHPHGITRYLLDGFSRNSVFEYFSKIFLEKITFH
jgi:hypothetical protein